MSATMRAKMALNHIDVQRNNAGETIGETWSFNAVPKSEAYPEDGSDENNTFAKFSPTASCSIFCVNPALFGKFAVGEQYYVDFTPAE